MNDNGWISCKEGILTVFKVDHADFSYIWIKKKRLTPLLLNSIAYFISSENIIPNTFGQDYGNQESENEN